jgi:hypothetical protein
MDGERLVLAPGPASLRALSLPYSHIHADILILDAPRMPRRTNCPSKRETS